MLAHNVMTEEWFAEVLQDSLEMDWTANDGARAIMRALEPAHTARPDAGDDVANSARALARRVEEWKRIKEPSKKDEQVLIDAADRVFAALDARPDAGDEDVEREWPLKAKVWKRTSVEPHEWVLEIVGTIGDTAMSCRHTQSLNVDIEDVPGLPELHDLAAMREGVDRGMVERGVDDPDHQYAVVSSNYSRPFLAGAYPTLNAALLAQNGKPDRWHIYHRIAALDTEQPR